MSRLQVASLFSQFVWFWFGVCVGFELGFVRDFVVLGFAGLGLCAGILAWRLGTGFWNRDLEEQVLEHLKPKCLVVWQSILPIRDQGGPEGPAFLWRPAAETPARGFRWAPRATS